jgi:hypothetical protein
MFCKALDVPSNATKVVQINEGMSKICLFQMKGSWACGLSTYDQFAFWSLKVFGCHCIVFTLQKHFVQLQMAFP